MAHDTSGSARRLARWSVLATLVALGGCGGGGGDTEAPPVATMSAMPVEALRHPTSVCKAAGFTALEPFVVNRLGEGTQQQVRFAGALKDGGFALAWLSHTPADTQTSWRLQWQRFDAAGRAVDPPSNLPYPDDVAPQDVAVLVQPDGRIIVAYAVSRPVDPANPLVVKNSVLARVFQDGEALPGEIVIGTQTVNVRSFPGIFHFPVLAGFDDGSFLGGWHLVGRVKPELWVQKVAGDGTPSGEVVKIDSLGAVNGARVVGEQLVTLPGGGWIAVTPWRTPAPDLQDYTQLTQVDLRHPLRTPDVFGVPGALPAGSVVLLDSRGVVVASGPVQPGGSASLQQFNRGGNPAGRPDSLALTPVGAASLSNGEAALVAEAGATISLQRISRRGEPIGQPLDTAAPASALAAGVGGGELVLFWARNEADASEVVAQRFTSTCSG